MFLLMGGGRAGSSCPSARGPKRWTAELLAPAEDAGDSSTPTLSGEKILRLVGSSGGEDDGPTGASSFFGRGFEGRSHADFRLVVLAHSGGAEEGGMSRTRAIEHHHGVLGGRHLGSLRSNPGWEEWSQYVHRNRWQPRIVVEAELGELADGCPLEIPRYEIALLQGDDTLTIQRGAVGMREKGADVRSPKDDDEREAVLSNPRHVPPGGIALLGGLLESAAHLVVTDLLHPLGSHGLEDHGPRTAALQVPDHPHDE